MTNKEKFAEIFGFIPEPLFDRCIAPSLACKVVDACNQCPFDGFWDNEYKECFKFDTDKVQALIESRRENKDNGNQG